MPYGIYTVRQTSGWEGRELMKPFDVLDVYKRQAEAYRKANGQYLRKNQWRDTTVRVLIDLD